MTTISSPKAQLYVISECRLSQGDDSMNSRFPRNGNLVTLFFICFVTQCSLKKEKSVSHRDVILSYFSAQSAQPNLQQEKNSASCLSLVDKTKNGLSKIKQFLSVSKG